MVAFSINSEDAAEGCSTVGASAGATSAASQVCAVSGAAQSSAAVIRKEVLFISPISYALSIIVLELFLERGLNGDYCPINSACNAKSDLH
jgi:hypothetical protein